MRLVLLLLCAAAFPARAGLIGRVVSPEGPLEGVVVSARHASGDYVEYPLPSQTNIRRVFVNRTTPPTFWVGNNHHATLVKVEPLE